ncbi:CBU_0592 family membrane protein [Luteimonas sp. RIT-PG2_3]|jgi:hypothetical protein
MLELQWYDWVGLVGTFMVLGAFLLLQVGSLSGKGLVYQLLNLFGAVGIAMSLVLGKFNLPAFLLQIAWILISIYGIARGLGGAHKPVAQPPNGPRPPLS